MKQCIECHVEKLESEFYRINSGLEARCKQCRRIKIKLTRKRKVYEVESIGKRVCVTCHQCKDLTDFQISRATTKGRMLKCRECTTLKDRNKRRARGLYRADQFYNSNEKYITAECEVCSKVFEPMRSTHKKCNSCTDLVQNVIWKSIINKVEKLKPTHQHVVDVAKMWIGSKFCGYCSGEYSEEKYNSKSIDHIIPLCKGGSNELTNLKICHLKCNFIKGRFLLEEMVKFMCRYM